MQDFLRWGIHVTQFETAFRWFEQLPDEIKNYLYFAPRSIYKYKKKTFILAQMKLGKIAFI